jgi:predicted nucleotidyltransferase
MALNRKSILNELKGILSQKLGDNLKDVILFGSQAYGTANDDSDYDFLIILKKKPDWKTESKISDYCYDIDLKYGIFADVHILGEEELNTLRGKQPIFQKAIQKGIYA